MKYPPRGAETVKFGLIGRSRVGGGGGGGGIIGDTRSDRATVVYACACDTHENARPPRVHAASALSRRPILITGGAPRDFSRKKLSGLALLTPFLKPVSRVNKVKRMRVLPARECVQKTVRTPSFA